MNTSALDKDIFELILKYSAKDYMSLELESLSEKAISMEQPTFSDKFKREIKHLINEEKKKQKKKKLNQLIKKFIYVSIFVFSIVFIAIVDSRYFKTKIFNYIFKEKEKCEDGNICKECSEIILDKLSQGWEQTYIPEYMPSGYFAEKIEIDSKFIMITFKDIKNNYLYFIQKNNIDSNSRADNNLEKKNQINIGENIGYFTENEEGIDLTWEYNGYIFNLICTLELQEAKKIAESLKIYH